MNKTKFTVRVDPESLLAAKQFAAENGTSITNLIEQFFRSLGMRQPAHPETPILNELIGSLSEDAGLDSYHEYLEEKYLGSSSGGA